MKVPCLSWNLCKGQRPSSGIYGLAGTFNHSIRKDGDGCGSVDRVLGLNEKGDEDCMEARG